jgi:hypothetical protein
MATSPSSTSVRKRSWLRNTSTGAQCATVSCSQPAASRRPKLELVAADFTIKEGRITAGTSTAVPSRSTIRRSTARTCPWFTCVTTAYTSASLSSSSRSAEALQSQSLPSRSLGLSVSRLVPCLASAAPPVLPQRPRPPSRGAVFLPAGACPLPSPRQSRRGLCDSPSKGHSALV